MPFADDVRKYTFASLDRLINKKGEALTQHAYLPTEPQLEAMDNFVDAMDLMEAGEKDEEGYVRLASQFTLASIGFQKSHAMVRYAAILQSFNPSHQAGFIPQRRGHRLG